MKTTAGVTTVTVYEIKAPITVYRIVRSSDPDDPELYDSFRSNYELGITRKIAVSWSVIHMGISAYTTALAAHQTAQKFQKLGRYVADVRLRDGFGFNYADTGHPLHWTLWGDPVKLGDAVVDIRPVR